MGVRVYIRTSSDASIANALRVCNFAPQVSNLHRHNKERRNQRATLFSLQALSEKIDRGVLCTAMDGDRRRNQTKALASRREGGRNLLPSFVYGQDRWHDA